MTEPHFRIQVRLPGDKTSELTCAHCKVPHPIEPEIHAKYAAKAQELGVGILEVWWCGLCYLTYQGLAGKMRHDCEPHDVPPFPDRPETA